MRPLLARALLAAALLVAAPALADEIPTSDEVTQQAKAHFRSGSELYREARYREAIAEFEAAYRLRPHGVIHYNVAQCHERLGELAAALGAYHEYLRAVPGAADRRAVEAAMANLSARLGATGVQHLFIASEPPGAEVVIDGKPRGQTPFAAALPLGPHRIELTSRGFAAMSRELTLTPDRAMELDLVLGGDLARIAEGRSAALLGAAAPSEVKASTGPRWAWVAAGTAAATLTAAVLYGLAARSASDELRSSEHSGAAAQQLAASASARSRNANVLYGVAAAAGAASVTLFVVEGRF